FSVDPNLLREGVNTIAAEVHLASVTATNLAFDLQLTATVAPYITGVNRLANRQAQVFLAGSSNSPTTIQATTNLSTWSTLGNVTLTNGAGTYTDVQATNSNSRFYRAYRAVP